MAALRAGSAEDFLKESEELLPRVKLAEEPEHPDLEDACDDVSGEPLDAEMAYKARMEEVEFTIGTALHDKVPMEECRPNTGKG